MGQCLRYQMQWEDLEEYQVGSQVTVGTELGVSQGRRDREEKNSCLKFGVCQAGSDVSCLCYTCIHVIQTNA